MDLNKIKDTSKLVRLMMNYTSLKTYSLLFNTAQSFSVPVTKPVTGKRREGCSSSGNDLHTRRRVGPFSQKMFHREVHEVNAHITSSSGNGGRKATRLASIYKCTFLKWHIVSERGMVGELF